MGISLIDSATFHNLFRSNNSAYGTINARQGEYDATGKLRVESSLVYQTPSPAVLMRHLNGDASIGLMPIDEAGVCHWGAIDIDNYDKPLSNIIRAIYDYDMPLCPFYSKSKKLHLYLFLIDGVLPAELQNLLRRYYSMFALPAKTEMFPKQRDTVSTRTYSWINMPYFGNTRCMIGPDNEEVNLSVALARMQAKQMSFKDHNTFLDVMPYSDAPPCIQSGCILRDIQPGNRNNFLFSVGVYYRLKDESADLDTLLSAVNESFVEPIEADRLKKTILNGLKKKATFICATRYRDVIRIPVGNRNSA